jgi:hypothetical protein
VGRDIAGPRRGLDPVLRERAGGLGREQAPTAGNQGRVKAPLLSIFRRGLLFNTLTACFWIASTFCVYYSIWALFSAYLQKELTEASHRSFLRRRLSAPPVGYWHSAARLRYAIVSEIGG